MPELDQNANTSNISNINNIPITYQNNQPMPSSNYYFDMILGAQIANHLTKFNAKNGFSIGNISILILLLSVSEIKVAFKGIYTELSGLILNNYKPIFLGTCTYLNSSGSYYWSTISSIWKKNKPIELIKQEDVDLSISRPNVVTFDFDIILEFAQGFINYLMHEKTDFIDYKISDKKDVKIENMDSILVNESWSDIYIKFNSIIIQCESSVDLSWQKIPSTEKKTLIGFNSISIPSENLTNFDDFLKNTNKKTIVSVGDLIDDPVIAVYLQTLFKGVKDVTISSKDVTNSSFYDCLDINNVINYTINCRCPENIKNKIDYYPDLKIKYYDHLILIILQYHFPDLQLFVSLGQIILLTYAIKSINTTYGTNDCLYNMFFNSDFTVLTFLDLQLPIPKLFKKKTLPLFDGVCFVINEWKMDELSKKLDKPIIYGKNSSQIGSSSFAQYCRYSNVLFFKTVQKILLSKNIKATSGMDCSHISDCKLYISNGAENIVLDKIISTNISMLNLNKNIMSGKFIGEKKTSTIVNFKCTGENLNVTKDEINLKFHEFIQIVRSNSHMSSEKNESVNIHKIKLIKTVTKKEIPNPDYTKYLEKKEYLESLQNNNDGVESFEQEIFGKKLKNKYKSQPSDIIIRELMNIPPKTIFEETSINEINTEIVNSGYKSFDTMYLRELDEKKLKSVLHKFTTKKELLKTLGLPNKLCILLDGLPGTGKSSAILTVASYLKKDIYYLSFGDTIQTNEDLQMIFDHVVKNCNGGIIVAEDIDAVGTLVHKRTGDEYDMVNTNSTDIMEDKLGKLSLSYFLNLVQGTITPDGLIFIATTNHLNKLDPAFHRHGRFDVKITLKLTDRYQINKIYNKFIGRDIPCELLNKISEDKFTPAHIIFTIKDYISEDFDDKVVLAEFLNELENTIH